MPALGSGNSLRPNIMVVPGRHLSIYLPFKTRSARTKPKQSRQGGGGLEPRFATLFADAAGETIRRPWPHRSINVDKPVAMSGGTALERGKRPF